MSPIIGWTCCDERSHHSIFSPHRTSTKTIQDTSLTPPITGPLRSHPPRARQIRPRSRLLPPHILQEHPRNSTSDQWLETPARRHLPRECHAEEGGCADEAICWEHWSYCARYVISQHQCEDAYMIHDTDDVVGLQDMLLVSRKLDGQSSPPSSFSVYSRL